jgi:enolase
MRYEHILTYDQDEHEKNFQYDNKTDRVGLESACNLINNEVNRILHGIVLDDFSKVDAALLGYFDTKAEKHEDIGTNVVKAVSEAILLATASCYQKIDTYQGINKNVLKEEFPRRGTKLLVNVLNGGKVLGSAVKFAKFYLIIDGNEAHG